MKRTTALILYLGIAGGIVTADLWSKDAVFDYLKCEVWKGDDGKPKIRASHPRRVIPGKLDLEAAMNTGAFNGWFGGMPRLLEWVSLVAVIVTTLIIAVPRTVSPVLVPALGLLAGGATGNLYDRMTYGGVRDFIKVYHGDWVWPNFNLADSAICTGVGLLILREFLLSRKKKSPPDAVATESPTPEDTAEE